MSLIEQRVWPWNWQIHGGGSMMVMERLLGHDPRMQRLLLLLLLLRVQIHLLLLFPPHRCRLFLQTLFRLTRSLNFSQRRANRFASLRQRVPRTTGIWQKSSYRRISVSSITEDSSGPLKISRIIETDESRVSSSLAARDIYWIGLIAMNSGRLKISQCVPCLSMILFTRWTRRASYSIHFSKLWENIRRDASDRLVIRHIGEHVTAVIARTTSRLVCWAN